MDSISPIPQSNILNFRYVSMENELDSLMRRSKNWSMEDWRIFFVNARKFLETDKIELFTNYIKENGNKMVDDISNLLLYDEQFRESLKKVIEDRAPVEKNNDHPLVTNKFFAEVYVQYIWPLERDYEFEENKEVTAGRNKLYETVKKTFKECVKGNKERKTEFVKMMNNALWKSRSQYRLIPKINAGDEEGKIRVIDLSVKTISEEDVVLLVNYSPLRIEEWRDFFEDNEAIEPAVIEEILDTYLEMYSDSDKPPWGFNEYEGWRVEMEFYILLENMIEDETRGSKLEALDVFDVFAAVYVKYIWPLKKDAEKPKIRYKLYETVKEYLIKKFLKKCVGRNGKIDEHKARRLVDYASCLLRQAYCQYQLDWNGRIIFVHNREEW